MTGFLRGWRVLGFSWEPACRQAGRELNHSIGFELFLNSNHFKFLKNVIDIIKLIELDIFELFNTIH